MWFCRTACADGVLCFCCLLIDELNSMDCVYVGALLGELIIHSGFCELPKLEVSQTGGGGGE